MKNVKGITLIALVITIIVLLILAGVSISLVLGNNGVLTQATNAVQTNRKATVKEEVETAWAGAESDYWSEWANNSAFIKTANFYDAKLKVYLASTGHDISVSDGEDEGTYQVNYTSNDQNQSYTFLVDENGKITPLVIGNAAEIASDTNNIGATVNYGKSYTGDDKGWQILYADNKNVYIITRGYLTASDISNAVSSGSGYNGTRDFTNLDTKKYPAIKDGWLYKIYKDGNVLYDSHNDNNVKGIEYLLDSANTSTSWYGLNNDFSKWVIGAPTVELLFASYDAANNTTTTIPDLGNNGYSVSGSFAKTDSKPWNHGTHYWLASIGGHNGDSIKFFGVSGNSGSVCYANATYSYAFRPVVCLKSSVFLKKNASGTFDLSFAE